MTDYWPAHWTFRKERSLEDNVEAIAQGLCMLSATLNNLADPALNDTSFELQIRSYSLVLLAEVANSIASEAMKIVDCSMGLRKARKGSPGPGKLISIAPAEEVEEEE